MAELGTSDTSIDIRYSSDTEKIIEISDLQSIGISIIVLQTFTSDTPILYRI
jgi:hypothetical protein